MDEQNIQALQAEAKKIEMGSPYPIEAELFSPKRNKYIKLINSEDDDFTVKISGDDLLEFKLDEPTYVKSIILEIGEYEPIRGFKIEVIDILRDKKQSKSFQLKSSGSSETIAIDSIISGFTVQPPKIFWKNIKLKKIEINGYQREDFDILTEQLSKVEDIQRQFETFTKKTLSNITEQREELEAIENQHASKVDELEDEGIELKKSIANFEKENETLEKANQSISITNAELKDKADKLDSQRRSSKEELLSLESEITKNSETLNQLNKETSTVENKLKELVDNKNLFTEEFKSFVEQSKNQTILYSIFAIIPILIFSTISYLLFEGTVDLTTKYTTMPNLDLLTIFTTRLPFVVVAVTLISSSFALIKFFLNRVIIIHRERLQLSKLAIIAKDVSTFSAAGLELSKQEQYEQRTYLKMQLLKSHLSGKIEEFEYEKKNTELKKTTEDDESDSEPETEE